MVIVKLELRQGRTAFFIWTAAVGLLLSVCVFLYPEMKGEMEGLGDLFASMGSFSAAFGMDRLNFGTLPGYYAVECGNVLGLGGAFYAALCAVSSLSGEEKEGTAEFLLSHPVGRGRVVTEKLAAVFLRIAAMNCLIYGVSAATMTLIGTAIPWETLSLLHLAYLCLQLELAGICFGISAFLRRGSAGLGLGLAAILYFLSLIANIAPAAEFLKYITPFGYCDGAAIVAEGRLNGGMLAIGAGLGTAGIVAAYLKYTKKDIL